MIRFTIVAKSWLLLVSNNNWEKTAMLNLGLGELRENGIPIHGKSWGGRVEIFSQRMHALWRTGPQYVLFSDEYETWHQILWGGSWVLGPSIFIQIQLAFLFSAYMVVKDTIESYVSGDQGTGLFVFVYCF